MMHVLVFNVLMQTCIIVDSKFRFYFSAVIYGELHLRPSDDISRDDTRTIARARLSNSERDFVLIKRIYIYIYGLVFVPPCIFLSTGDKLGS